VAMASPEDSKLDVTHSGPRPSALFRLLEFYGTRVPHRGQWRVHTLLRRMLKADVDADFQVTRGGLRWQLNPSDFVQADLFWYGHKDYWETYHLRKLLQQGSVLFDIGANIGYYAITLAATLGNECRVYAFEPFPPTYERLLTHITLNSCTETISAHRLALSDREGVAHMSVRVGGNSGSARLDTAGESIPTTTLDIFCALHRIDRLDFVKIDAEGHEEFILAGGAQTIRQHRPRILLEFDPPLLNAAGSSVERVVSLLRSHGYSLHTARRDVLVPMETLPAGRVVVNAFAFPQ
jgi:FkbM family methyltransferase